LNVADRRQAVVATIRRWRDVTAMFAAVASGWKTGMARRVCAVHRQVAAIALATVACPQVKFTLLLENELTTA